MSIRINPYIIIMSYYSFPRFFKTIGFVRTVSDGIVGVVGLENVCYGEMVSFNNNEYGLVLNLEARKVSVIVLGKDVNILPGDVVCRTFNLMNLVAGDFLLGTIVDPLGKILIKLVEKNPFAFAIYRERLMKWIKNNNGLTFDHFHKFLNVKIFLKMSKKDQYLTCLRYNNINSIYNDISLNYDVYDEFLKKKDISSLPTFKRFLEARAPSIIARSPVNKPLETGLKVIDSMVPIGHGQRELIIGDSKTGKTSIAIDTILNQKNQGTICIYVAIGQKKIFSCKNI